MAWVKFNSHRAREKAQRLIKDFPVGWYSFERNYHLYPIRPQDEALIVNIKGVTIMKRLPQCQWSECWSQKRLTVPA